MSFCQNYWNWMKNIQISRASNNGEWSTQKQCSICTNQDSKFHKTWAWRPIWATKLKVQEEQKYLFIIGDFEYQFAITVPIFHVVARLRCIQNSKSTMESQIRTIYSKKWNRHKFIIELDRKWEGTYRFGIGAKQLHGSLHEFIPWGDVHHSRRLSQEGERERAVWGLRSGIWACAFTLDIFPVLHSPLWTYAFFLEKTNT